MSPTADKEEPGLYRIQTPIRPRMYHFPRTSEKDTSKEWWEGRDEISLCGVRRSDWQESKFWQFIPLCKRCKQAASR